MRPPGMGNPLEEGLRQMKQIWTASFWSPGMGNPLEEGLRLVKIIGHGKRPNATQNG